MGTTNITFCGAGFLGMYHIGVVSCFKFYAKRLLKEIKHHGGCSSGALAACMMICDLDLEDCIKFVMRPASKVRQKLLGPISLDFDPTAELRNNFIKYLPADAYRRVTGKLFVSLTRVSDLTNVIISEYSSNDDLIDVLVCTCFVPLFSGIIPPKYNGEAYIDGGFTDNHPQDFEGTTITVSPFGGESDICPDDRHKSNIQFDLNNTNVQFSCHNYYRMMRAFLPPNNDVLVKMCCDGFNDAVKYLHKNYAEMLSFDMEIVSVPKCLKFDLLKSNREEAVDGYLDHCSSCGNESETSLNEVEHRIAKERVLSNIVFPLQLSQILRDTKLLLEKENLNGYVYERVSEWIKKPYQYSVKQMMVLSETLIKSALSKLQWLGTFNSCAQKVVDYASRGFHAYMETVQYEWHPSLEEKNKIRIQNRKERLKSVEQSFVALPSRESSRNLPINTETESNECSHNGTPSSPFNSFEESAVAIGVADTGRNSSFDDLSEYFDCNDGSPNVTVAFSVSEGVTRTKYKAIATNEFSEYSDSELYLPLTSAGEERLKSEKVFFIN